MKKRGTEKARSKEKWNRPSITGEVWVHYNRLNNDGPRKWTVQEYGKRRRQVRDVMWAIDTIPETMTIPTGQPSAVIVTFGSMADYEDSDIVLVRRNDH